jgi:hypothetical protein
VLEEELLDHLSQVSQAEYEFLVPIMGVIPHEMEQYRAGPDIDQGFGNGVGMLPQTGAQTTAKKNNLHAGALMESFVSQN